ncbi:hypothetical protein, partial [Cognatilysobacter terrigena]|uniref:hypothetical protein n=1 Tax=Cognatilysobacter terrigena TaxID=2488749 RepID=UPI001AACA698
RRGLTQVLGPESDMSALALMIVIAAHFIAAGALAMFFAATHELRRALQAAQPELLAGHGDSVGWLVQPAGIFILMIARRRRPAELNSSVAPYYRDSIRYGSWAVAAGLVIAISRVVGPSPFGA